MGGISTVAAEIFQGFDYVALGHLHKAQHVGGTAIRYAGSLLKYSFAEADHRKTVDLVEIDGKGTVRAEAVALSPRRDLRCIEGFLADILVVGIIT